MPTFHTPTHKEHCTRISRYHFGESREIDWGILCEIRLEEEVHRMLSVMTWWQLFHIIDSNYEQLALKVLATFDLSSSTIAFYPHNNIHFYVFVSL